MWGKVKKALVLISYIFLQLVEKILEEGTRSPRTIRLAALHLTGLWLSNPNTIKYYMKELKQLTLYGSGMSNFALVYVVGASLHIASST